MKVAIINGPNLNLLGNREKSIYGEITLREIENNLKKIAKEYGAELLFFQSNHEGEIINFIHDLPSLTGVIINPAAFTHTSVAIRDALLAKSIAFIEVHLSNVYAREDFRKKSFFSDQALGVITGLGAHGYEMALQYFLERN